MDSQNPHRNGSQEPSDARISSHADEDSGALMRSRRPLQGTPSCRQTELAKRFRALKKEFLSLQRIKASHFFAANKAALESYVSHRLQNALTRSSLPIPKLGDTQTEMPGSAGPAAHATAPATAPTPCPNVMQFSLSDRRVTVKPFGCNQPFRSYIHVLPAVQPPPLYTTWSYLKRNELARDHGRRMFLVDAVGETVPADDGETEERLPWEDVDGAAVDYAMTKLAEEYGWEDPEVLEALLDALRPKPEPEAIAQRLAYLQRLKLVDKDRENIMIEEVLDAFVGSFCRRCRIYGCRTHSGGHVKPHHRPAPPPPDTSGVPCGPGCWRNTSSASAGASGSGSEGGAAATVAVENAAAAATTLNVIQAAQDDAVQGSDRPSDRTASVQAGPRPFPSGATAPRRRDDPGSGTSNTGNAMDINEGFSQPVMWMSSSDRGGDDQGLSGTGPLAGNVGPGSSQDISNSWRPCDLSLVRQGIQVFGLGNPCMVTLLLAGSHTCAAVKQAMERIDREQRADRARSATVTTSVPADVAVAVANVPDGALGNAAVTSNGEGAEGGAGGGGDDGFFSGLTRAPARRKGCRTKKAILTNNKSARSLVVSARAQHGSNDWHEYQPCTCMGKCKADCPCVRAHNFCEKFCACSTTCRERFRGCTCKSGCKTNMCPCWAAGRECDPDLCSGCAPTLEGRAELGRDCQNMRLRMRQHALVVLGTSDIPGAGWGLFAAQYVAKNGFLGEYTGDLITQDEANRRGSIYDFMNNSYLFNLNNEWVVDAKFRGNKLRCANHSEEPVAKAKVLLVDGESRIAILADKSLTPGMEITYDYRYSDDTAPHWVKKKRG